MKEAFNKLPMWLRLVILTGGPILIVLLVTTFPVVQFNDTRMRAFTWEFDRPVRGFDAWVLCNHVLETEYGEIMLRRFAPILAGEHFYIGRARDVAIIRERAFARGRASHNLVVEGMVIPQNVQISFTAAHQFSRLTLNPVGEGGLRLDSPEILVSGIPLRMDMIDFHPRGTTADIEMSLRPSGGSITLADSTVIDLTRFFGLLRFFKDDEKWELVIPRRNDSFLVKLPNETEFADYRSITFRPHWGEFIEGELAE